ncbi:MAG: O-antigen ligase family protein [Acidimicrobiales bacterium]
MNRNLPTIASLQLAGLVWLSVFHWAAVPALTPLRWPVSALVWALPFLWLFRSPEAAKNIKRLPLATLVLWAVWYFVAINWSLDQQPAIAISLGVFSVVLAGSFYAGTFGWERFAKVVAMTLAAFLVAGLAYRVVSGPMFNAQGRHTGIAPNPTDIGRYGAIMALAGISGFKGNRRVQLGFLMGGVLIVVLAVAKTAMIGLGASLIVLAYRTIGRNARTAMTAGLAVGLIVVSTLIIGSIDADVQTSGELLDESALTLTGRTEIWSLAWEAIQVKPIVGHGTNSSGILFEELSRGGQLSWQITNAHNLWLQSILEHGILGVLLLVATFGAIVLRIRSRFDPTRDSLLVMLTINSMTEALVQYPELTLVVLAGVAGALSYEPRSETDGENIFGVPYASLTAPPMPPKPEHRSGRVLEPATAGSAARSVTGPSTRPPNDSVTGWRDV